MEEEIAVELLVLMLMLSVCIHCPLGLFIPSFQIIFPSLDILPLDASLHLLCWWDDLEANILSPGE